MAQRLTTGMADLTLNGGYARQISEFMFAQ